MLQNLISRVYKATTPASSSTTIQLHKKCGLNLEQLIVSPTFLTALDGTRHSAIESWMKKEREVILEVPSGRTPGDVYSWGEFVGSLADLAVAATGEGVAATAVENLGNLLERSRHQTRAGALAIARSESIPGPPNPAIRTSEV